MMKIFDLKQIKTSINLARDFDDLLSTQKSAFIDFSSGLYDVPPPMQFIFPNFGSDYHIKGGYKQGSQNLIIKIANSSIIGNNGILIVFDISTGKVKVILEDQGFLTTLRTAFSAVIASELVPWEIENIGIIGSGDLTAQTYKLLKQKYPIANIMLYARNKAKASIISDLVCDSLSDLLVKCNIVFTTTSSKDSIIHNIPQFTNKAIILLGSDDEYKSEISPYLFEKADMIITDSKLQALKFGDIGRALQSKIVVSDQVIEIGSLLQSSIPHQKKIIIADFSGIGAQDVAISEFILDKLI